MATRFFTKAMPGIVFVSAFAASGACGDAWEGGERTVPTDIDTVSDDSEHHQALPDCDTPSSLEIDTRLHSCQKLAYTALAGFLSSRGVNLALKGTPDTAGELYTGAVDSFGVPKPDSRVGEKSFHTTAAATKLFDIFLQAAPEIIANIADSVKAPACTLNGANQPMFDPSTGACVEDSVTCLLGRPATPEDMLLCDVVLSKAAPGDNNDLMIKQRIAVALILSAGHTCE